VNREATEERDALVGHNDDAYRSGGDAAESCIRLDLIPLKSIRPHRQPGFRIGADGARYYEKKTATADFGT
jgi:hypothetical protein